MPFKKEQIDDYITVDFSRSNRERINQLESEKVSLKSKIDDLNEMFQAQSNEINDLKFRLNKYEPQSNDIISFSEQDTDHISEFNQSEQTMLNLQESNHNTFFSNF
jgi:predicted  nucleic acid-binding Zn-ribbon protein